VGFWQNDKWGFDILSSRNLVYGKLGSGMLSSRLLVYWPVDFWHTVQLGFGVPTSRLLIYWPMWLWHIVQWCFGILTNGFCSTAWKGFGILAGGFLAYCPVRFGYTGKWPALRTLIILQIS